MEVLDKILQDHLNDLETTGLISVNKVMNLESAMVEVDPSLEGFITKDIPLSKFSISETTTNLEEVKLSIKSFLTLRSNQVIAKEINENSVDNMIHKLNEFEHYITVLESFVKSCVNIDPVILNGFRNFKFNTLNEQEVFEAINENVSFIRALEETDLKDIFCPNGLPKNLENTGNANDVLFGVLDGLKAIADPLDNLVGLNEEGEPRPTFTYGYSITLKDITDIVDNSKAILDNLKQAKMCVTRCKEDLFGPFYIKYTLGLPEECKPFFSIKEKTLDAIVKGNWPFADREIHMQEGHEPLCESFIIIRDVFGKGLEH